MADNRKQSDLARGLISPEEFWSEADTPEAPDTPDTPEDLEEQTPQPVPAEKEATGRARQSEPTRAPERPVPIAGRTAPVAGQPQDLPKATAAPIRGPEKPKGRPADTPRPPVQPRRPADSPRPPVKPQRPAPQPEQRLVVDEGTPWITSAAIVLGAALVSAFLGWLLVGRPTTARLIEEERSLAPSNPAPASSPDATGPPRAQLPAPPTPTQTALIEVSSDPAGAIVFLNGEQRGVTPTTLRNVPAPGKAVVRILLPEHKPWEQTLELDSSDLHRYIEAGLRRDNDCQNGSGFLYITSEPAGATIELNGKRLPGKTPMVINDLCAGEEYDVRLRARNTSGWRQRVTVEANEVLNLEAKLPK